MTLSRASAYFGGGFRTCPALFLAATRGSLQAVVVGCTGAETSDDSSSVVSESGCRVSRSLPHHNCGPVVTVRFMRVGVTVEAVVDVDSSHR
jgi:hypothetical protein